MTSEPGRAVLARIQTLLIVGVALVVAGLYSVIALWYSLFARYMHVEDLELGLDEETIHAITRMTSVDQGIMVIGAVLAALGVAALVSARVRWRNR